MRESDPMNSADHDTPLRTGHGKADGARGESLNRDSRVTSSFGAGYFLLLALALFVVRLPLLGRLPLSGDEAYYWECSRHVSWSYFDQPPLMIWLLGFSTSLLGVNETAARLPALAVGLALSLGILAIGLRLFRDARAPLWALIGLIATPLFTLGTIYTSTDVLLCLFALGVPPLAALAILERRPRLWLLVGFLGGLGGLAKFSAVLYVPVVLALALLHPNGCAQLRRPEPYCGALLGMLAVSPALIWAALHNFDNITFQLVDRHVQSSFTLRWLGEYLGGQCLLVSPLLLPLLFTGVAVETCRALREKDLATLALALPACIYPGFFALVALRTSSAPHWAAPGYLGGALVTARWAVRRWPDWRPWRRRFVAWALASGMAFTLGVHALLFLYSEIPSGWSYNKRISTDVIRNAYGWRELAAHIRSMEGTEFTPGRDPIICDSYTTASLIAFYSQGRYDPLLMASAGGKHGFAYLYWQSPMRYSGRLGVYVGDWRKERTRESFERAYGEVSDLGSFKTTVFVPGGPSRSSQSWRFIRGERLTENPDLLTPFTPLGRRRSQGAVRNASLALIISYGSVQFPAFFSAL